MNRRHAVATLAVLLPFALLGSNTSSYTETFGPFYDTEIDARTDHLRALFVGDASMEVPFGPLQTDPRLPP